MYTNAVSYEKHKFDRTRVLRTAVSGERRSAPEKPGSYGELMLERRRVATRDYCCVMQSVFGVTLTVSGADGA